jgi:hypothetical protein
MVLGGRPPGRVGRRRIILGEPRALGLRGSLHSRVLSIRGVKSIFGE